MKRCMCCGLEQAAESLTCGACGEASWSETITAPAAHPVAVVAADSKPPQFPNRKPRN